MLRISKKGVVVFLFIGILLFFAGRIAFVKIHSLLVHFTPQQAHLVLEPPKGSVVATVDALHGAVKKEGRTDDAFKDIIKPTTLLQGESIATDSTSSATITFPHTTVSLTHNAQIDFVNASPKQLVIRQPEGLVSYTTTSTIDPFSIRSLALLIQWSGAAAFSVTTSSANQTVQVKLLKGALKLAYADNNSTTQVEDLTAGQSAVFDNTAFTLTTR